MVHESQWAALLALAARARRLVPGAAGDAARTALEADIAAFQAEANDPLIARTYGGLVAGRLARTLTVAQIAQSLGGRLATVSGHSRYISGEESLDHLHRLRALADAVVIGATSAELDDPLLTTRRVSGPNAVRVVLDPRGRVTADRRIFTDGAAPTLWLRSPGQGPVPQCRLASTTEIVEIPMVDGVVAPDSVLDLLHDRGLRMVLIEGGGATISHFIAACLIDRLHVTIAPILIGSGRPGIVLPPIDRLEQALKVSAETLHLGTDVLLDCSFAPAAA